MQPIILVFEHIQRLGNDHIKIIQEQYWRHFFRFSVVRRTV